MVKPRLQEVNIKVIKEAPSHKVTVLFSFFKHFAPSKAGVPIVITEREYKRKEGCQRKIYREGWGLESRH